jgi:hypothetical protein
VTHNVPAQRGVLACEGCALRLIRRLALAATAVALAGLAVPSPSVAQGAEAASIRLAPTIVAAPGSEAVLRIEIGPAGAVPSRSFLNLRGLPPTVALTDGHAVGPGWWAVPLSALPTLKAQIPGGLAGRSELVVSLIDADGQLLAQARGALVIQAAPQAEARGAAAPAAAPPALDREQQARAEHLVARGETYLATGNIMSARDFFERAADAGLARGALRLASTYDPVELKRLKVQGVAPDVALARKWYQRARDLGAAEAALPLARLGTN